MQYSIQQEYHLKVYLSLLALKTLPFIEKKNSVQQSKSQIVSFTKNVFTIQS